MNSEITFIIDAARIRQLGSHARNEQMSTEEAQAFLRLFREQLEEKLGNLVKEFVTAKLV